MFTWKIITWKIITCISWMEHIHIWISLIANNHITYSYQISMCIYMIARITSIIDSITPILFDGKISYKQKKSHIRTSAGRSDSLQTPSHLALSFSFSLLFMTGGRSDSQDTPSHISLSLSVTYMTECSAVRRSTHTLTSVSLSFSHT